MQIAEPGAPVPMKARAPQEAAPELLVGDQPGDDGDQQHDPEEVDHVAADGRQEEVGVQHVDEAPDGDEGRIADHLACELIDPDRAEAAPGHRHQGRGGPPLGHGAGLHAVHPDVGISSEHAVVEHAGIDPVLGWRDPHLGIDQPVDLGEKHRDRAADHHHRQQDGEPQTRGRMNQKGDAGGGALAPVARDRRHAAHGLNGHRRSLIILAMNTIMRVIRMLLTSSTTTCQAPQCAAWRQVR